MRRNHLELDTIVSLDNYGHVPNQQRKCTVICNKFGSSEDAFSFQSCKGKNFMRLNFT